MAVLNSSDPAHVFVFHGERYLLSKNAGTISFPYLFDNNGGKHPLFDIPAEEEPAAGVDGLTFEWAEVAAQRSVDATDVETIEDDETEEDEDDMAEFELEDEQDYFDD